MRSYSDGRRGRRLDGPPLSFPYPSPPALKLLGPVPASDPDFTLQCPLASSQTPATSAKMSALPLPALRGSDPALDDHPHGRVVLVPTCVIRGCDLGRLLLLLLLFLIFLSLSPHLENGLITVTS